MNALSRREVMRLGNQLRNSRSEIASGVKDIRLRADALKEVAKLIAEGIKRLEGQR